MPTVLERVTVLCFAMSYAAALGLEIGHQAQPRPIMRLLALIFGGAGLLAHTIFIGVQPLALASSQGSLLFLAWILAVFYLYGSIHHGRLTWGLFVLPLVLALVVLAEIFPREEAARVGSLWDIVNIQGERFWGLVHGGLVLLAAVGVSVGFVASMMYLVQVHRLKAKLAPGQGVKLLSLERIEAMNRRAILWSFPMLTAGLLVGVFLQVHQGSFTQDWLSPKILSTLGLWLVFGILLYLRYAAHARGRRVAWWTVAAFALLLLALISPVHPFLQGGGP